MGLARTILGVLAFVHAALPFTPRIPDAAPRIVIASLILSASYLVLAVKSRAEPAQAFWSGFALLALVVIVSSWTGASPVEEAWIVKLLFLGALAFGALAADRNGIGTEGDERTGAEG
jgi:hypothetical protein